jgi:hypothetical protein
MDNIVILAKMTLAASPSAHSGNPVSSLHFGYAGASLDNVSTEFVP